jgi:hypothetical protein
MASKRKFSFSALIARLLVSLLLVFATYNPSGYSIFHWLVAEDVAPASLKLLALIVLAMLYYAIFRVIFAAFRWSGLIAASLVSIGLSFLAVPFFLPETSDSWSASIILLATQYVVPTSLALVMAFGVSWSHIVQRLTGQQSKRAVG